MFLQKMDFPSHKLYILYTRYIPCNQINMVDNGTLRATKKLCFRTILTCYIMIDRNNGCDDHMRRCRHPMRPSVLNEQPNKVRKRRHPRLPDIQPNRVPPAAPQLPQCTNTFRHSHVHS